MINVENESFNLTTDPWIKVIEAGSNQEKKVSLIELFENAQDYRQLAGDMRSQDLAILRLLLAILTTVYLRVDATDQPYSWLDNPVEDDDEFDDGDDNSERDLLTTWQDLQQAGHFSSAVTQYLKDHTDDFNFFGDRPFYQVTATDYDALVPKNKQIAAGKGQVLVKQLNRRVSESANTPSIFAPKTGEAKSKLALDELVRWVITYQNYAGVTDKTKIETDEKFSNPAGWVYRLNPVFAKGNSLFKTLMLNLVLVNDWQDDVVYAAPKPVWEFKSVQAYVAHRKTQILPDNLPELYTAWSRILHIEWGTSGVRIFSAGVPMYGSENALIEPMTTWRFDKKTTEYRPAVKGLRSLGIAMWRNFGQYVNVRRADDVHEPGIVVWLRRLKHEKLIAADAPLILDNVALISDGNATSQSPAAEVVDDMQLQTDVLFDQEDKWPVRIEEAITVTQTVGTDYYHFASDIGQIRNLDVRTFAGGMSAKFYDRLNEPFKEWLAGLSSDDDRDAKISQWKQQLERIVIATVDDVMQASSPRDIAGIAGKKGPLNIFTAKNHLMYNVRTHLDLKKGVTKTDGKSN